ncbi:MAG: hypothetical protein ACO271_09300 [Burkholderiales bacterium]
MKKLSLSVIGMSVVAAFALPVQAANQGQIELRGSVAQNCGVVVSTLAKASALSITGGESNATVGTVQETCNVANGYTVTLGSANAGKLKNGSSEVAFSVAYDNATGAISSGMTADRTSAQFNKSADVKVSFTGFANAIAGTYADDLTITIAAK